MIYPENASIGIIGGSDGPTSIIVSDGNAIFIAAAAFVLVAIVFIVYFVGKKKG